MFNLQKAIIPSPVKIQDNKNSIKIASLSDAAFSFEFSGCGEIFAEASRYLTDKFTDKYSIVNPAGDYKISLVTDKAHENFKGIENEEAYFISINKDGATLCGIDEAGAYYAAISFMALVHKEKNDILIPECFILDVPNNRKVPQLWC